MGVMVSLSTVTGDNIYITKHNGLKSFEFTENMTNSATEPFCGVVSNSGRIIIEDKNLILKNAIINNVLQKSGFEVIIGNYDNGWNPKYCTMYAKRSDYSEDNTYTIEIADKTSKWTDVNFNGINYVDREGKANLYELLYSCLSNYGYSDIAEDLKNSTDVYYFPKSDGTFFESTVPNYLKKIYIPYTFLDKTSFYDAITKICKAALLVCYNTRSGQVVFVPAIAKLKSTQYGVLTNKNLTEEPFKDVIINNVYDKVSVFAKNAKENLEYATNVNTANETVNNYSIYSDAKDAYAEERYKFNTFNYSPTSSLYTYSAAIAVNSKYYHTFNIIIPKYDNNYAQENLDVFYGMNQDETPKIGVYVKGKKQVWNTYAGVEIGGKDASKIQIQSGTQPTAYITVPTLIWEDKNRTVNDSYNEQFTINDVIKNGKELWKEEITQKGHPETWSDDNVAATIATSFIQADGRSTLTPIIQNVKTSKPTRTADGGWQFSLTCVLGGETLLCATGRNPENYSISTPPGQYWRCSLTEYAPVSIEFSFNGTKKVISLEDKYVSSGTGTTNVYLINGESSLLSENSHIKIDGEQNDTNLAQYVANSVYNHYKTNGKHTITLSIVNGKIKGEYKEGSETITIDYIPWGFIKSADNTIRQHRDIIRCNGRFNVKGVDENIYRCVSVSTSYDGQLSQRVILQEE